MLKIGMNLLLWTDSFTLEKDKQLMDKVIDMGFDGLEIPVHAGMTVEEAGKIGDYLAAKNVPVTTLSVFFPDSANPVSSDKSLRDGAVEAFKLFVDCTTAMGAKTLVGPFSQGLGYFSGKRPTKEDWNFSIDTLRRCCEYAGKHNVEVAVEPLNRFEQFLLNTAEDSVRYIKELDMENAGLLLDTMHMNIEELNVAEALKSAMPYVKHIHISENNRGIPGTGHACGKDVFDVILNSEYSGWLNIEAFNEGADSLQGPLHLWRAFAPSDDELAKQGLAYIRSMISA